MLEVFDELGMKPKLIAGTSIGAIFGAAYASGLSAREIRFHAEETLRQRLDIVRQLYMARSDPVQKLLGLVPRRNALLKPEALLGLVMPSRLAKDFDALEIPLKVVASDYVAQDQVILDKGPLLRAVAASMALPVIFSSVKISDRVLMDGGLVNPLPFDLIVGEADITVAIDVSGAERVARQGAAWRYRGDCGVVAHPSAFDRAREIEVAAAGHLHQRGGERVPRAGVQQAGPHSCRGGAGEGGAAPQAVTDAGGRDAASA